MIHNPTTKLIKKIKSIFHIHQWMYYDDTHDWYVWSPDDIDPELGDERVITIRYCVSCNTIDSYDS